MHFARRHGRAGRRTAAATVELALMLPLMLLVVFGSLEVCQRLMLRQTATVAAYETARLAARRGASANRALDRGQSILAGRQVVNGLITINPADMSQVATGDPLLITVTVPIAGNTNIHYVLPNTGSVTVSATMLRE